MLNFNYQIKLFLYFLGIIYFLLLNKFCSNNHQIKLDNTFGDNQGLHPKVIAFKDLWNGYKYWMVYTPYLYGDETKENPVINVSNDLKTWISPKGVNNPLDIPLVCDANNYNSDTHLLFNDKNNQLELFWRYVNNNENKVTIYKIHSKNGINWNKSEIFLESDNRKILDFVSPVIMFNDNVYRIWYVNHKKIYYIEKKGQNITIPRIININYKNDYLTWHFDLIYNEDKKLYELIACAYKKKITKMPLFYISSKDNENWTIPIKIMEPSHNAFKFDSESLYRSSLIYENKRYFLLYSAYDKNRKVGMSIKYGENITNLKPYIK